MAVRANITNPQPPVVDPMAKPSISTLYTAQLDVRRDGAPFITLETPLPENFMFGLTSNFDRPFAQPLSQLAGDAAGMGAEAALAEQGTRASTGMTSVVKYLSAAVWSSGSELTFDIPFVIHAYSNAQLEVVDVVKKLLQLAAPDEAAGFLKAPGPYIANFDAIKNGDYGANYQLGGDDITLSIGRFIVFNPCIIRNVQCTFDTQFDSTGAPLSAMVNVTFESYYTTTKADVEKLFDPLARGVRQFDAQQ